MTSDTAFLGDFPAGYQLADSYDSLGESASAMSTSKSGGLDSPGISPRLLYGVVNNLRGIGIEVDENNRVLRGLTTAVMTNYSLYLLYTAYKSALKAHEAKELGLAAAETSALVISQQWGLIAQGAAAAILAASAFAVGEKFGSGDWKFPSFDMSNPMMRRRALRQIQEVRG